MYKHILIATDGSELAEKAVNQGLGLAKALGAKVSAVTITEPRAAVVPAEVAIASPIESYEKAAAAHAAECLTAVDSAALALHLDPVSVTKPDSLLRRKADAS